MARDDVSRRVRVAREAAFLYNDGTNPNKTLALDSEEGFAHHIAKEAAEK